MLMWFNLKSVAGKTFPEFPANVQPAILRIWWEANEKKFGTITQNKGILFTRGRWNRQINYSAIKCTHIDHKGLVMAVAFRVHIFAKNIEHTIINMKTRVATKSSIQFRNNFWRNVRYIETVSTSLCGSLQGLYSLSGKTSYRKISWSLEAARFVFRLFQSRWNLTSISAAMLPRCLSNFRTIRSL